MIELPRHAEIWLPGYVSARLRDITTGGREAKRVWLTIADHYEPYWNHPDEQTARDRVALWRKHWPEIADRAPRDSSGRKPRYTFFYPEEEYREYLLEPLAEMARQKIADVEVHIHHNGEGRQNFIDRMSCYIGKLTSKHGLLHQRDGKVAFGFIHGNWALDNSLPGGVWCGLNDEISILRDLGCYADFTMPSGNSHSQSRMVNTIYWATDDPQKPKSYDRGLPLVPGRNGSGDLLMIPGPLGLRWRERLMPRLETGELASTDVPTKYRFGRWMEFAPRIGSDVFIKLYTHGTQERNSSVLLKGGSLDLLFKLLESECAARGATFYYASAWEMYQAVKALAQQQDPTQNLGELGIGTV